jgi:fructose-1,6-bisphosphatase/inositol monophosphatase family enzyme
MLDAAMNLWDCAAIMPIIEEAGGRFTTWDGTPTIYAPDAVATNGLLHDQILGVLKSERRQA